MQYRMHQNTASVILMSEIKRCGKQMLNAALDRANTADMKNLFTSSCNSFCQFYQLYPWVSIILEVAAKTLEGKGLVQTAKMNLLQCSMSPISLRTLR